MKKNSNYKWQIWPAGPQAKAGHTRAVTAPPCCEDEPVIGPGALAWLSDNHGSAQARDLAAGGIYTVFEEDAGHTMPGLGQPWGSRVAYSVTWWPRKGSCSTDAWA